GIGYNAVLEALKKAFFDLRTDKVVAKVKKANMRSRNLFKGIGFMEVKESEKEVEYQMTKDIFWKIAS
ncbi:GNAT family N-acetyltransferase, partial [Clostridium saudiense]|nr:GNAT family N-acetyltransferase [Clostridium saudiense]